jgi:nicotinate-nucleotide adenylyltransferase
MPHGAIAYYFGSFDPIHEGHLTLARTAHAQFGFSKIVFVLAYCPPNKLPEAHTHSLTANFEARCHHIQQVIAPFPYLELNVIEATLPPPTYTIDTLRAMIPGFNERNQSIPFLMGADSFQTLDTWKESAELARRLWFIVAPRQSHSVDVMPLTEPMRVDLLNMPPVDVSSSQLRMTHQPGL